MFQHQIALKNGHQNMAITWPNLQVILSNLTSVYMYMWLCSISRFACNFSNNQHSKMGSELAGPAVNMVMGTCTSAWMHENSRGNTQKHVRVH